MFASDEGRPGALQHFVRVGIGTSLSRLSCLLPLKLLLYRFLPYLLPVEWIVVDEILVNLGSPSADIAAAKKEASPPP